MDIFLAIDRMTFGLMLERGSVAKGIWPNSGPSPTLPDVYWGLLVSIPDALGYLNLVTPINPKSQFEIRPYCATKS